MWNGHETGMKTGKECSYIMILLIEYVILFVILYILRLVSFHISRDWLACIYMFPCTLWLVKEDNNSIIINYVHEDDPSMLSKCGNVSLS